MLLVPGDFTTPETATSTCFAVTPGTSYIFGGKDAVLGLPELSS